MCIVPIFLVSKVFLKISIDIFDFCCIIDYKDEFLGRGTMKLKLFMNEIRKQMSGRTIVLVLLILLLLNSLFAYIYARDNTDLENLEAFRELNKDFNEDPEAIRALFEKYENASDEYNNALLEWVSNGKKGDRPIAEPIPHTYSDENDDQTVMFLFFRDVLTEEQYKEKINANINEAFRQLRDFDNNGYDKNAYIYRYQIRFIEQYRNLVDKIDLNGGYVFGWDLLFSYSGTFLFAALAMIFIGSRLFPIEKDTGMHLILRTTKKGRWSIALTKILTVFVLSFVVTIIFFLSSYAVIDVYTGFSSWNDPIQQIKNFFMSPHLISIMECLILTMLLTALTLFALSIMTACFTLIMKYSFAGILASAAICGVFFFLSLKGDQNFIRYANIFTVSSGEKLFSTWRALHVGDHPVSQIIPISLMIALLSVLSIVASLLLWAIRGIGVSNPRARRIIADIRKIRERFSRPRIASLSLPRHELKKLFPSTTILICTLIMIAKIFSVNITFSPNESYQSLIKQRFIDEYEEYTLDETYDLVSDKVAYYDKITSTKYVNDMAVKRINDEITYEEYQSFRDEYDEAIILSDMLVSFQSELEYLVEKEAETGIAAKPIVSTGFYVLMDSDFDIALTVLIIVIFSDIYSKEYEIGFISLMKSTKRGRNDVFWTKTALTCGLSMITSAAFFAVDLLFTFGRYDMSYVNSPLFAIRTYSNTSSGVTIMQYILLTATMRTVSFMIFALLVNGLSGTLCTEWITAGVSLLMFIPYLLYGLGIKLFQYADISILLSFDRLYLLSTALGGVWLIIMLYLIWSGITLLLTISTRRKLCK